MLSWQLDICIYICSSEKSGLEILFFRVISILMELKSMTIDDITKVFTDITIYLLVLLPLLSFSSTLKEVGSF